MKPYQERVVQEQKELDIKIGKLEIFVDSDHYALLDDEEQERLENQIFAMQDYSEILGLRISAFNQS